MQLRFGSPNVGTLCIPEKDQLRVFERYYRGSNTSGIVGSGVGLYLVRTIVDLHEGTIALHSREGQGLASRCACLSTARRRRSRPCNAPRPLRRWLFTTDLSAIF
jgi:light-regulated signal transduction histidine kinase (bacteriophytochrome)